MDSAVIYIIVAFTMFSQAAGNFTDGQTINMVLSPDTFDGKVFLRGNITEGSTVTVVLDRASSGPTGFVIFQVHSYNYSVSLSYKPTFLSGDSVYGTDIGLYSPLNTTQLTFFIRNSNTAPVDVILIPVAYQNDKPIPGGCNLSFAVNIAPYMTLTFNDSEIFQVDAQPAATAGHGDLCKPSTLEYEVYELNIQSTSADAYFDAILSLVTVNGAVKNGQQTRKPISQPLLRRRFANYLGFGKIIVASVKDVKTGASSAYVPVTSYDFVRNNRTDIYDNEIAATFTVVVWFLTCLYIVCCWPSNETHRVRIQLIPGVISAVQLASMAINPYLGVMAAVGIGILLFGLLMSVHVRPVLEWICPVLFALCTAQLAFGATIWCGLGTMQDFEGPFMIWGMLACLYLITFSLNELQRRFDFAFFSEILVFVYALLALISQAGVGAFIYLYLDSVRILHPKASDAIFSKIDSKGDVLLSLWPFFTVLAYLLSRFVRPRTGYSEI